MNWAYASDIPRADPLVFDANGDIIWGRMAADGELKVDLYFFWSEHCPHCTEARPQIEDLARQTDWLSLHSLRIEDDGVKPLYRRMAESLGQEARSVPAFLFCGAMLVGFDVQYSAPRLGELLTQCYEDYQGQQTDAASKAPMASNEDNRFVIPGLGELDASELSLPILTLVLAGLDSFNPCAFFVLLFLLSLLVHAGSRRRMLLIGGLFIVTSGVVYFLFMAAWLNLFMWVGDARWITALAGVVAVILAIINIKDFFRLAPDVSLSMSGGSRSSLFGRMRQLLSAENTSTLVVGTLVLALLANSYELLCTAGFPMVYTRALTLQELPSGAYYAYLIAYNMIYVIPLLVITLVFIFTLGSRKLKEHEGRALKLMSGTMMLGLGLVLLLAPDWLNNLLVALGLLLLAVVSGVLGWRLAR